MTLSEESVLGHRGKHLEPERQIDFLRRYHRGEIKLPYDNPSTIIWAARKAINEAVNILENEKRKYTDGQIAGMSAEVDALEKLIKENNVDKKPNGENVDINPKEEMNADKAEIRAMIDKAVVLFTENKIAKAHEEYQKAVQKLKEAELQGIDVTNLQFEARSLSKFFSE